MRRRAAVSWSGGKDGALALYEVISSGDIEVACLLTTLTEGDERVAMHGIRRELIEQQAAALGYALEKVYIPNGAANRVYEERMGEAYEGLARKGIRSHIFGDIFLEDIRAYRERNLARLGLVGLWPLWAKDTRELAQRFLQLGFSAIVCCVDSQRLGRSYVGRRYDMRFLEELPGGVDPCGERGEFHTFVYDGPLFRRPIGFRPGEVSLKNDRFYYIDLLPA